jgi:hypothetical protein
VELIHSVFHEIDPAELRALEKTLRRGQHEHDKAVVENETEIRHSIEGQPVIAISRIETLARANEGSDDSVES